MTLFLPLGFSKLLKQTEKWFNTVQGSSELLIASSLVKAGLAWVLVNIVVVAEPELIPTTVVERSLGCDIDSLTCMQLDSITW